MKEIQMAKGVQIGFLVLLLLPQIVSAQWVPDGIPVCTEDYDQHRIDMISDGLHGAIIVWADLRNGEYDIYARRVYNSGVPLWPDGGAEVCTQTGVQDYPQITSDGAGGAIITWQDGRNGTYDIYAQRLDAWGSPFWTAGGVAICTASGSQYYPKITSDGAGGAVIAWLDGNNDVYAQRIDADGSIHSGWAIDGEAICTADGQQYEHQIASDGSGGAIIVWRDERISMWAFDIYAQRINSSGDVEWTPDGEFICNSSYGSQIIPDGAGGAIITYTRQVTDYGYIEINAQRINASGILQWSNGGPYACGTEITNQPYQQLDPQIISDGSGGAIITWRDRRTGNDNDIYAQRVNSSGTTMWTDDGVGICIYSDEQLLPQIAADGAGGAIIAWTDDRNGNEDIYAQRVDADGSIYDDWPLSGFGICTYTGDQSGHQIIYSSSWGDIIAWEDSRATSIDIYAHRTGPICEVAPASLDFGTVELGDWSELIFTITNIGNGTLTGSVSESCPYYSIVSTVPPDDPYNLANGEQVVVTVHYEPTLPGTHLCTIETGAVLCTDVSCTGAGGCPSGTLYVDADATHPGYGTSWLEALNELRDALVMAETCEGVTEIWVAEGTYTPTGGSDRSATFELRDGLALYGGFVGTETLLSERDVAAHPTVLSGEIGEPGISDNSYHVVTGSNTGSTAVLDGFTVTRGNADGADDDGNGGGMYVSNGSPTVSNVTFRHNAAVSLGGGMYNSSGNPMLSDVTFKANTATSGGGMYNSSGNPVLFDVIFEGNSVITMGGGMYNSGSGVALMLINVIFNGNSASGGGGIYNISVLNSKFTNVTFSGNSATTEGGAMRGTFATPVLTNVIMWGDTAPTGPEIYNYKGSSPTISYSLIEGCGGSGAGWDTSVGTDGGNNIDADPRFKGAYSPDSPLSVWSSSPAIEAGYNPAVPAWVTTDIDGNPRIYGGVVDMGAYEYQGSPTGVEDDQQQVPRFFALYQNTPNPFNPTTTLRFDLPRAVHVKLCVYNVKGELVSTIVDRNMAQGRKEVSWTAKDDRGRAVSSGVYFYRLVAGGFVQTKKMILLR